MTTIAQVRQAVRPLIQQHSDLASIGRFVMIKPVRHIWRAVFIESTIDPHAFAPRISLSMLIPAKSRGVRGFGQRIFRNIYGPRNIRSSDWDIRQPETIKQMLDMIENEALPKLRTINTFEDYFAFISGFRFPIDYTGHIQYLEVYIPAANGDLELSRKNLERDARILADIKEYRPGFYRALVDGDRFEIARILHEWEAATVTNHKLEKIWERTPFPLEL
ncbi:hypothetical protein J2X72_002860 [Phyllobacterium sp. 1468]|uniref:hypothetical protein n=1 Tax=Phyllobacterium sp. 1468 TaxID=2817759 RepID=UPI0028553A81|nr:hypothetical protein [Phyllobacterium sp. 1468]MDR6634060.1 hypothetical protein [Phyllobacterium sp. 1468]